MRELEIPDLERVADVCDQASQLEMSHNKESVQAVIDRIEKAPDFFDGLHCVDCGQEIVAGRLKTGAFRDIHCQEKRELKLKQYRSK